MKKISESRLVKKIVYSVIGIASYPGLAIFNKLRITGAEQLMKLPKNNVLFVSNHQTYFADVITFLHIFCAIRFGKKSKLGVPYYLLNPFVNVKYVAAEKTMNNDWLSRLFTLAGAITVKRTWNETAGEQRKGLDPSDTRKIARALDENWVITFPQGTTTPYAPGRKGTALIIKYQKPIVIPVVIKGFNKAFDKKGLKMKKKKISLQVAFKAPLQIDYEADTQTITKQLMEAIEQSADYKPMNEQNSV